MAAPELSTTTTSTSVGFSRERKDPLWQCVQGCGACCKLDKGPTFPSPEEVFDDPSDIQLYKSLIGPDGWCVNYEKETRTCAIYAGDFFPVLHKVIVSMHQTLMGAFCYIQDRPYFCRVEPEIFQDLYGIDKKKFNKEACNCCVDTIKAIYGSQSQELDKFNHAIRSNIADGSDNLGPCGEPISPQQESFYYEFDASEYGKGEANFSGRPWYEYGLTEEAYQGGSSWLADYESYLVGCWGEDMFSPSYDLKKADDSYQNEEQGDCYYSYIDDLGIQPTYDHRPWFSRGFSFGFGYGVDEEDDYGHGMQELESSYGHSFDEMKLCEKIFGPWPCLFRPEEAFDVE
ncbi:LOW QUALITY PROTEIN: hypothetical protein RJ639_017813 [Escallonia herrerae]|uniref:Uncharacterized protein n=1 Tax=Escallonia herrerae TaxID=1293975 RepID=A0AA88VDC2_9ASTE|nr:LOW QUALITY PROTEIN: hypothetical protein RJ639_017813 [Escallonia herrerae]